jgi:hypothetical protein
MHTATFGRCLAVVIFCVAIGGGASAQAQLSMGGLFQQIGGMDAVGKIANNLLQSSVKDPRLAGVLGSVNVGSLTPKVADQMCSMLGGGCKAPLTDQQMAAGAKKFDANQTKALNENFTSALGTLGNPLVKQGVSSAIGPKLSGIVGGLI